METPFSSVFSSAFVVEGNSGSVGVCIYDPNLNHVFHENPIKKYFYWILDLPIIWIL
jgi:hypothetical protein